MRYVFRINSYSIRQVQISVFLCNSSQFIAFFCWCKFNQRCSMSRKLYKLTYTYIYMCIYIYIYILFFCCGAATQRGSWPPHTWGILDHTQRRTTVGRTPLEEWSARRRDLYLTTHNTHNRQTSMPPVGFELTISAGERPQTYALDCAATGTG